MRKRTKQDQEVVRNWEEFLNPAILRGKLISASIYLALFELLKDSVVDHIKSFFTSGFDQNGSTTDPKYHSEVLVRNPSRLYASLSWLHEHNVIDEKDIESFEQIKKTRNRVAHEMLQLATKHSKPDHLKELPVLIALLRKIEVWWILNVEIPTNPDFDGAEIDEDGILPGPLMAARIMTDVALGSEEEASRYLNALHESKSKL